MKIIVALLQSKERRVAEVVNSAIKTDRQLTKLIKEWQNKHDLPADATLVDLFIIDDKSVPHVDAWLKWRVGIDRVYEYAIDSLLHKATDFGVKKTEVVKFSI